MKLLAFCEKHVNVESLTNAFINNFITYTFFYICGLNKQVLTVDDAMLMITLKDQGLSKLSSLDNHCGVLVNLFWPVTKRDRFWPVENEINQYIFFSSDKPSSTLNFCLLPQFPYSTSILRHWLILNERYHCSKAQGTSTWWRTEQITKLRIEQQSHLCPCIQSRKISYICL